MKTNYYSQNDEQKFIEEYFKNTKTGLFIEIGAFHPIVFSNTRCLVEKGWNGIYVEPSPKCAESFKKEYADNNNIMLVEKAITADGSEGKMVFYESNGDAVSSLSKEHAEKWSGHSGFKNGIVFNEINVETISMNDFLINYKWNNCIFFNLDVEGINIELFRAVPDWFWNQIKMACIEHDGNIIEISARLMGFGFHIISINKENIIMAK